MIQLPDGTSIDVGKAVFDVLEPKFGGNHADGLIQDQVTLTLTLTSNPNL